jgi:hypothetical protein
MNKLNKEKISNNGSQDNENKIGRTPGVKKDTGYQYPGIPGLIWQQIIDYQKGREKVKEEEDAAENHLTEF